MPPPVKPIVKSIDYYTNFDNAFLNEKVQDTPVVSMIKENTKNAKYDGFTYSRSLISTEVSIGQCN